MATEVERSQLKDAVNASWAALGVEEDPTGRRIGNLPVEAEERGGGGGVLKSRIRRRSCR